MVNSCYEITANSDALLLRWIYNVSLARRWREQAGIITSQYRLIHCRLLPANNTCKLSLIYTLQPGEVYPAQTASHSAMSHQLI